MSGYSFGVYVHIPFCASRCDYCAFATWTDRHHLIEAYCRACVQELEGARAGGELTMASSVFFGGGTPSQVPPNILMSVLDAIPRRPDAEVTVECNPDDVTPRQLEIFLEHGVTRVSIGVQSTNDRVLKELGRSHQREGVFQAVELIREAGLASFSLDLIYGSPAETEQDWTRTLQTILALAPPHVSAYALTVEPGTALAAEPSRHPEEDSLVARYELADRMFSGAGLEWYEISNWAKPGHECQHNQLYWSQGNYLGIGCAAHSHRSGHRWWNIRTPERYVAALAEERRPRAGEEFLSAEQWRDESVMLGIRMRHGLAATDSPLPAGLDGLVEPGAQRVAGQPGSDRLVLTRRGRLLANEVAVQLMAAGKQ